MQSSEQLDTRIYLAASADRVAGMMLQRMPDQQGMDVDAWNRATILADTIKPEELLQLSANDLLIRLFHEETLRRFEQEPLAFACSCSREKVGDMLQSLGKEEVDSILAEHGQMEIDCEFCGRQYRFDAVEAAQLFTASRGVEPTDTRH
jgi:molecular chaperone Hsp33